MEDAHSDTPGYIVSHIRQFFQVAGGCGVARYIQKISLIPYSAHELWVGWELEGVHGEVPGLIAAERMSEEDLKSRGVSEFQRIPQGYVGDVQSGELLPPSSSATVR